MFLQPDGQTTCSFALCLYIFECIGGRLRVMPASAAVAALNADPSTQFGNLRYLLSLLSLPPSAYVSVSLVVCGSSVCLALSLSHSVLIVQDHRVSLYICPILCLSLILFLPIYPSVTGYKPVIIWSSCMCEQGGRKKCVHIVLASRRPN